MTVVSNWLYGDCRYTYEDLAQLHKNPMKREVKRLFLNVLSVGSPVETLREENHLFENLSDFFPSLETLVCCQSDSFGLPIQNLISVLNAFGDVKNLGLSNFNIILTGLESYDKAKWGIESDIYQEAVKIIDDKFPVESTQIKIFASREEHEIVIKEKGSRPFLKVN